MKAKGIVVLIYLIVRPFPFRGRDKQAWGVGERESGTLPSNKTTWIASLICLKTQYQFVTNQEEMNSEE